MRPILKPSPILMWSYSLMSSCALVFATHVHAACKDVQTNVCKNIVRAC